MDSTLIGPTTKGAGALTATPSPQEQLSDPKAKHIRGSSLLLVGRVLAAGLGFAAQVLAVRFFSKAEYGALAWALSVAALGSTVGILGLDKAAARFMPIYREHGEKAKLQGALMFQIAAVLLGGLLVVGVVDLLDARGLPALARDPLATSLLLVLIWTAPVAALDGLLVSFFAAFSGARAIFFRKHLLGPLLKIAATIGVIALHGSILTLAWGLMLASVLGTAIYLFTLVRMLRRQGLLHRGLSLHHNLRIGELMSFALPMFGSDMVIFLRNTLVVMLLQHFKDAVTVAAYQAVNPVARLSLVIRESFVYLFVPTAARLHARGDRQAVEDLYCQTSAWVSMLSFPLFVFTCALAKPLTVLLFGARYADSAPILALLSFGQFLNATAGIGLLTLRVLGKVRALVMIDAVITVLSLSLNLLLIPPFGAIGAAVATTIALVAHSALSWFGLYRVARITLFHSRYIRFFSTLGIGWGALLAFQLVLQPPFAVGVVLGGIVVVLVGYVNRHLLDVAGTFPQVERSKLLHRFFKRPA